MSDAADETASKDLAPAVTRALRILGLLQESRGVPQNLSELARALGAAKSSTSNICAVLEEGGMIRRAEGGYLLGLRTAELGGAFTAGFNQVREFYAVVESIPDLRGEVVQIAVRDGLDALYLARHEGREHRLGTPLGSRLPLIHSGTGTAILSTLGDDEVERVLARADFSPTTEHSAPDAETVRRKLAETRARGYALDRGESFGGILGVAAPLTPWRPTDPLMAIGVALPVDGAHGADALAPEVIERVGAAVLEATARLTNPFQRAVREAIAEQGAAG